ncbi:MAG: serine/threonine protein kinase [Polyangiaceae bacterium]|nr:serine/threonine protein kinase [Polyangiaceae bacterium]MCW5788908.1 serine/threonine protein kinase [Polyangiaceae bacterium]
MKPDPLAGTNYKMLSPIDQGGMGEVVLAERLEDGAEVVVKLLLLKYANDPRLVDRMEVEAQILEALKHPNIVEVLDHGVTPEGRPFFVMERLHGRDLADHVDAHGNLGVYEVVRLLSQLLAGLEAAHERGVIHRDLKPSNVFLAESFGSIKVKLIDFGIGKVLGNTDIPAPAYPTEAGTLVGTPQYAAPEQVKGRTVDARTDLYAAGLLVYHLIAGRGPFDHSANMGAFMRAQLTEEPKPPSFYCPDPVPLELDELLMRALAKDPADRFQSASEMRHDLQQVEALLRAPVGYAATTTWDAQELRTLALDPPSDSLAPPRVPTLIVDPKKAALPEELGETRTLIPRAPKTLIIELPKRRTYTSFAIALLASVVTMLMVGWLIVSYS